MRNFFFKFPTENSEENEELAEEQDEDYSGKNYNPKMYLHNLWITPITLLLLEQLLFA